MSIFPVTRTRQALLLIGPDCRNYTTGIGSCWDNREPDAEYSADRWCDGCIAAWGLGRKRQKLRDPHLRECCNTYPDLGHQGTCENSIMSTGEFRP